MKNLLTAVFGITCLALFSCQKEVDDVFSNNGNTNGNALGSLKKMVITYGPDSSVTDFFYDNSGKVIGVNITTVSSGSSEFNNETIERNSQGMIQKTITRATSLLQIGVDSLVATVTSASGRYTNRVLTFSVLGSTASLSSFYYYDVNGRIVSQKDYIDDGTGNVDSSRMDYAYSGSNLVSYKGYDLSTGTGTPDLIQLFEFDSKAAPLSVGNEAYVLNNFFQWYSANNIKKMTVNASGDPDTHIETWDYTYNSTNRPVSANITQDGQTGIIVRYIYN